MLRWGADNFGIPVARDYYKGLLRVLDLIGDTPKIAREVGKGMRAHPYRSHIIINREGDEGVEVLSIRHGMSNWRKYL